MKGFCLFNHLQMEEPLWWFPVRELSGLFLGSVADSSSSSGTEILRSSETCLDEYSPREKPPNWHTRCTDAWNKTSLSTSFSILLFFKPPQRQDPNRQVCVETSGCFTGSRLPRTCPEGVNTLKSPFCLHSRHWYEALRHGWGKPTSSQTHTQQTKPPSDCKWCVM